MLREIQTLPARLRRSRGIRCQLCEKRDPAPKCLQPKARLPDESYARRRPWWLFPPRPATQQIYGVAGRHAGYRLPIRLERRPRGFVWLVKTLQRSKVRRVARSQLEEALSLNPQSEILHSRPRIYERILLFVVRFPTYNTFVAFSTHYRFSNSTVTYRIVTGLGRRLQDGRVIREAVHYRICREEVIYRRCRLGGPHFG